MVGKEDDMKVDPSILEYQHTLLEHRIHGDDVQTRPYRMRRSRRQSGHRLGRAVRPDEEPRVSHAPHERGHRDLFRLRRVNQVEEKKEERT